MSRIHSEEVLEDYVRELENRIEEIQEESKDRLVACVIGVAVLLFVLGILSILV